MNLNAALTVVLVSIAAAGLSPCAFAAPFPTPRIQPDAEEAKLLKPAAAQDASSRALLSSTRDALTLPMNVRIGALRAQGPEGYRTLTFIMFDQKASMNERWKATTAVGRLGGELSVPELERAYKSSEWFMRSAALMAMQKIDRVRGVRWAQELLDDKALVVRAAAVDSLAESRAASSAPALWRTLYAKSNYSEGESLWIRRRIVETLASIEGPESKPRFLKALADRDESLHAAAIEGLERISHERLGAPDAPLSAKRELWLKHAKKSRNL